MHMGRNPNTIEAQLVRVAPVKIVVLGIRPEVKAAPMRQEVYLL